MMGCPAIPFLSIAGSMVFYFLHPGFKHSLACLPRWIDFVDPGDGVSCYTFSVHRWRYGFLFPSSRLQA